MAHRDDEQLIARARQDDQHARRELVERMSLQLARVMLGTSAPDRQTALRELADDEAPVPGLGIVLASIATDSDADVHRAVATVIRARIGRWGRHEQAAIGTFAARHAGRLGAGPTLELLAWAMREQAEPASFVRAVSIALGGLPHEQLGALVWQPGFEWFVIHAAEDDDARHRLVDRWTASPLGGAAVAAALLAHHERSPSCVRALDSLWRHATSPHVWAASLGEALASHRGMSGRDAIAAWGWRRFCDHAEERVDLYGAFRSWRELWIALRRRLGAVSAIAHLELWGALDLEQLVATVDEAIRIADDSDWPRLVDRTFDLAELAPVASRRPALAGACRIAGEISRRVREDPTTGIEAAAARVVSRAEALGGRLQGTPDPEVAMRADDLAAHVRSIRATRGPA